MKSKFRKLLTICITASLLLFSLSGCMETNPPEPPDSPSAPNFPSTPEAPSTPETPETPETPFTPESTEGSEQSLFEKMSGGYIFASGAGAWGTYLTIEKDGSFSGSYHDSDMGDQGEGYPHGTVYVCNFSGKFTQPEPVNEYTYSAKIEQIQMERTPNEEEIIDDIRYVYSGPYGLEGADEILIYLPGTKTADLPETFLEWANLVLYDLTGMPEEMPCYGLYNVAEETGFIQDVNA